MGRMYTESEILRALKLYERLGDWKEVARILDRTPGSLMVTICKYRKGRWSPKRSRAVQEAKTQILEAGVEQGMTTQELLAVSGLAKATLYKRLRRMGIDSEIRQESARLVGRSLPGPCFPPESHWSRTGTRYPQRSSCCGQETDSR